MTFQLHSCNVFSIRFVIAWLAILIWWNKFYKTTEGALGVIYLNEFGWFKQSNAFTGCSFQYLIFSSSNDRYLQGLLEPPMKAFLFYTISSLHTFKIAWIIVYRHQYFAVLRNSQFLHVNGNPYCCVWKKIWQQTVYSVISS